MTRQIEPETQAALSLRTSSRDQVAKAFGGDTTFALVPAQPYLKAPQGPQGFPSTSLMETKGLTFYGTDTPPGTAQDVGSIMKQINVLEAFRRSDLSRRQPKRDMLLHLVYEFGQADVHDAAMLKDFVGTNKVPTE